MRRLLWQFALLGLFVLAAAWRLLYLGRLALTPFADALDGDSQTYWAWSDYILRHGPLPSSPFFLSPLYPYALAALKVAGLTGLRQILVFQSLIGAGAAMLLADAIRRIAGWRAALAVGVLLALSQSATFFDGLVLPESLLFSIEALLVWYVLRADWTRAGAARFAGYGLIVGVLAQGRPTEAVLLALAAPLAFWAHPGAGRRLGSIGAAIGIFAVCCLPSLLANLRASGELIPFTYSLGFNLRVGNNRDADGTYVDVTGGSIPVPLEGTSPTTGGALDGRAYLFATDGAKLGPAESSSRWAEMAVGFARQAPGTVLRLAGRKLLLAWNRRESPQIESMESFRRAAGPLGLPWAGSFAFSAILGLAGIAWVMRAGTRERWLAGYLMLVTLAMTPFFVTDRYRHHLVPALAVVAGTSLVRLLRDAARGPGYVRLRVAAALALAAAFVLAPIGDGKAPGHDWAALADHAIRLLDQGAHGRAAAEFARAEGELGAVRAGELSSSQRAALAAFYFRYGIALEATGRHSEAVQRWERAVLLDPNDAASLGRLYVAYRDPGHEADAARVRRRLEVVPGGCGQILLSDGWQAAGRGDLAGADELFLRSVHSSPDLEMAWEGLIRVRLENGRREDAFRALEQARDAGLKSSKAVVFESYLALQRGDEEGARRALERLRGGPGPSDAYLAGLANYVRAIVGAGPGPHAP